MAFMKIDKESPDSITSRLDFFSFPCTNVSLSDSDYREIKTLNPVSEPPLVFQHPGVASFSDFAHSYIKIELVASQLKAGSLVEEVLKDVDNVSLIQAPGATFFRNLRVNVNGKEVS